MLNHNNDENEDWSLVHKAESWISGLNDRKVRACFTRPQHPVWDYESESHRSAASIQVDYRVIYLANRKKPHEKASL